MSSRASGNGGVDRDLTAPGSARHITLLPGRRMSKMYFSRPRPRESDLNSVLCIKRDQIGAEREFQPFIEREICVLIRVTKRCSISHLHGYTFFHSTT